MEEETEQTSTEDLDSDQPEEQETTEEEVQDTEETEGEEESLEDDGLEDTEYEGKQYKLPKELKEALLRQSDYTKKTTEVAELRRQAEAQAQQSQEAIRLVSQFHKEYSQLTAIDAQLEELKGIDWNQAVEIDSQAAMKLQFKYSQLLQQRGELAGTITNLQTEVEQKQEQARQGEIQASIETCKREIPNFGKPETDEKIYKGAQFLGMTREQVNNLIGQPLALKAFYYLSGIAESQEKLKAKPKAVEVRPTQTVKSGKSAPKPGLSDDLSANEWIKRRNAELLKARR